MGIPISYWKPLQLGKKVLVNGEKIDPDCVYYDPKILRYVWKKTAPYQLKKEDRVELICGTYPKTYVITHPHFIDLDEERLS